MEKVLLSGRVQKTSYKAIEVRAKKENRTISNMLDVILLEWRNKSESEVSVRQAEKV